MGTHMQNYLISAPTTYPESDPLISIIIPAHNESGRLNYAVKSVLKTFESTPWNLEIIIVDDGSTDHTYQEALELSSRYPAVNVISSPDNRGKGYAIRTGFMHSRGDAVGFIDADLEYPVNALPIMADLVLTSKSSCVIASRVLDDRRRLERMSSQMAHKIASAMLRLPIKDTQAGMKMFPGDFARSALTGCQQDGWLYDIEALLRAVETKLTIIEVPVMQKSVRRRRANLWTMASCGPTLLAIAWNHWKSMFQRSSQEMRQMVRFGMVGILNSVVDLLTYWTLITLWNPHRNGYQAGFESLVAWIVASVVGYVLHSRYTFKKRLSHSGFYVVTGIGVAIQVLVAGFVTHWLGSSDALAGKFLGIMTASLVTYFGYRYVAKSTNNETKFTIRTVQRANIPTVVYQEP